MLIREASRASDKRLSSGRCRTHVLAAIQVLVTAPMSLDVALAKLVKNTIYPTRLFLPVFTAYLLQLLPIDFTRLVQAPL